MSKWSQSGSNETTLYKCMLFYVTETHDTLYSTYVLVFSHCLCAKTL